MGNTEEATVAPPSTPSGDSRNHPFQDRLLSLPAPRSTPSLSLSLMEALAER